MVTTIITIIIIIMLIKRGLNIFAAASLLALSSCASLEENPSNLINMWFEVSGTVMDPAGFPIEGISVIAESAEPVQTDVSGRFTVQGGGVPAESASILSPEQFSRTICSNMPCAAGDLHIFPRHTKRTLYLLLIFKSLGVFIFLWFTHYLTITRSIRRGTEVRIS